MNLVFVAVNVENVEFALPFVSDFCHRYYSYLMALPDNLVVGKRINMVEHEAGRGFFNS